MSQDHFICHFVNNGYEIMNIIECMQNDYTQEIQIFDMDLLIDYFKELS